MCWLCHDTFMDRRLLKRHLSSSVHSRMTVVCPWCTDKQETFARPNDLKRHAHKLHFESKLLGDEFFKESNAFWLSVFPDDYRLMIPPTSYSSKNAMAARSAVLNWVVEVNAPSRTLHEWQDGWEGGQRSESEETPRKRLSEGGYSPSASAVDAALLTVINITYQDGLFLIVLSSSSNCHYNVQVSSEIHASPRFVESLSRRMVSVMSERGSQPCQSFDGGQLLRGQLLESAKTAISKALGIPASLLQSVKENYTHYDSGFSSPTPSSRPTPLTTPIRPLPIQPSFVSPGPNATSTLPRPFPLMIPIQPFRSPPVPSRHLQHMPQKRSMSAPTPVLMEIQQPPTTDITSPHQSQGAQSDLSETNLSCSQLRSSSISSASSVSPPCTTPALATQALTTEAPEPDIQASKTTLESHDNIRKRALNLLRKGGMPLFPPARRQWDEDEVLTFVVGGKEINWPPKGWSSYGPGQRLSAVEYMAMLFEFQEGARPVEKVDLLDKYNFLVLPGIAAFPLLSVSHGHQARTRNYSILQQMATTGKGNETLLTMLEYACVGRDHSVDQVINVVETSNVKMRLG